MTTIIALPPRVSTACWAAFCTTRSSVIETDGAGEPSTSCSTATSTLFWLTLTIRQPAWPSSWLMTDFFTSATTAGAKCGSVGSIIGLRDDHDARQPPDRREDLVVVGGLQGDPQIQRVGGRAGLFRQQLRVVERVQWIERMQGVDHGVGRPDQGGSGLRRVQRVVVQVARRQDVAAAEFVHRGAPRLIGAQREGLVLTQPRMQVGGGPADLPVPLVARHLQLAVVAPFPVLGQVPGEAVVDRAGVLGVFRAEDLRVQVGGLQPGPRRIERFPGLGGVVADLGGRPGVADGQRAEELLRRRAGTLGPRGAARERDPRDEHTCDHWGQCCFCCHRYRC